MTNREYIINEKSIEVREETPIYYKTLEGRQYSKINKIKQAIYIFNLQFYSTEGPGDKEEYINESRENQIKRKIKKTFNKKIIYPTLKSYINEDIITIVKEQFSERDKMTIVYRYKETKLNDIIVKKDKYKQMQKIPEIDITKEITLGDYNRVLNWYKSYEKIKKTDKIHKYIRTKAYDFFSLLSYIFLNDYKVNLV